jgi:hypothetical protein
MAKSSKSASAASDHERWLNDPKEMQKLQDALAWAQANPPRETNWDEFLKMMNDAN